MGKKKDVLEFPHAKGIVVSGDIHGDFTQLVYKCKFLREFLPNISDFLLYFIGSPIFLILQRD